METRCVDLCHSVITEYLLSSHGPTAFEFILFLVGFLLIFYTFLSFLLLFIHFFFCTYVGKKYLINRVFAITLGYGLLKLNVAMINKMIISFVSFRHILFLI